MLAAQLLDRLTGHRPLPGHHHRMVEGRHQGCASALGVIGRCFCVGPMSPFRLLAEIVAVEGTEVGMDRSVLV